MSGALRVELASTGILIVTLDTPGERVNTLSRAVMAQFAQLLDELESRSDVRGVMLCSGKKDGFIAGADVRELSAVRSAVEGETLSREAHAFLDRLEAVRTPVVAAIDGACLGGGLELALACRYRVVADNDPTRLGFPEVQLGLIPGAGGTQRLPRLVGERRALELILTGRRLRARQALRWGLVDEVVAAPILLEVARAAAGRLAEQSRKTRGRRPWLDRLISPIVLRRARAGVMRKGGGHYPAPLRAIEAIHASLSRPRAEGMEREARLFGELIVSDAARALTSVFFATQASKKDAPYPEGTRAAEVRKVAVVGAGLMGAGIASVAADVKCQVRLKDVGGEALGHGLREARRLFEERVRRGSLDRRAVEARMHRIAPTLTLSGFRRADLVIEAVFEDLDLKRQVRQEVESATREECVYATNTSSLPIAEIAEGARRPHRILGMHFFSPVHKMPLVEVVVTPESDAWATATAVAFGRRLGKHVIVVRDGPGFYTTRALAAYLNEAVRLLEEGARTDVVDRATVEFGFPVGPFMLLDEVGIDVGAKIVDVLQSRLGSRFVPPDSIRAVAESGRRGRKNARGFYVYGRRKRVDESLYALLSGGPERRGMETREIQERLVFAFLNETVLCLQEGVLRSARDGDVGAIFGLGFPPFLGGPFRYLDHLGARFASEVLARLQDRYGDRFTPAALLLERASTGQPFHAQS